jgi:hypothetical protein
LLPALIEAFPVKTPFRRRLAKIGALLGGATLLWACNAPPIVVPPPAVGFTSQLVTDAQGTTHTFWTAAQPQPFAPAAGARFYIFDQANGWGVIQTAGPDGTFSSSPAMEGTVDDRVLLYYQTPNNDYSDSICLLLRDAAPVAPFCP